jgi:hypothetical protein
LLPRLRYVGTAAYARRRRFDARSAAAEPAPPPAARHLAGVGLLLCTVTADHQRRQWVSTASIRYVSYHLIREKSYCLQAFRRRSVRLARLAALVKYLTARQAGARRPRSNAVIAEWNVSYRNRDADSVRIAFFGSNNLDDANINRGSLTIAMMQFDWLCNQWARLRSPPPAEARRAPTQLSLIHQLAFI